MIGAFANILGSMVGASSQSATNSQMMRFQEETNKQQMQFNREEAEKNRQFQERMANSEISRRIADMRAAGLNPAFADSLGGATTPQGSQASANLNGSPNLKAPLDPLTASQVALNTAQADKLKAETSKTEKETDWIDALNQQTIDESDSNIKVNGSLVGVNEETKKLIAKQIEETSQKISNLKKEVEKMDSEITKNDIDSFFASGRYSAEIDAFKAQAHLSNAEAKELLYLMTSKKALMLAQANQANTQAKVNSHSVDLVDAERRFYNNSAKEKFWLSRNAYWDAGTARINYELTDEFGEADHWVGYAKMAADTGIDIAKLVLDYKTKGLMKRDVETRERAQHETERHNRRNEDIYDQHVGNESVRDYDAHIDRNRDMDIRENHYRHTRDHYENQNRHWLNQEDSWLNGRYRNYR